VSQTTPETNPKQLRQVGLGLGVTAYLLWGFLPLYLHALEPTGPVEVIAHRVCWTLLVCLAIVLATRRLGELRATLRSRSHWAALSVSGALLTANWLTFVYAISSNQLAEAALGYFLNPLVTVLLAVLFLHERLRPGQWLALLVASSAVVVITLEIGRLPWIALVLAVSFGVYGFVEKRVGKLVSAATAMTVETLAMTPLALGFLGWLAWRGQQHFTGLGPGHAALLVGVGLVTAVPLLLFNGAARRLPLSTVGLLQYMCPLMQLLTALWVFNEPISSGRWIGFALIWLALAILVAERFGVGTATAKVRCFSLRRSKSRQGN
jgi:chloramphenicol-sensitive protein RarD